MTFWKDGCGSGRRKDQSRGKGGGREVGWEAPAVSQARGDGDQDGEQEVSAQNGDRFWR